ncbi:hypothetical protein Kisp01_26160 [Kineosporia sp. NBRC 101677]|uniref:hypothetical protein n=1 Tax=Kineosporia sp. NBRC 101677 TaxID=3032197 RepID=UPI0024A0E1FE|nr:hypothetical protein [Kineosporia sp. NBRC 101677]GLY15601.1 hypothetical protein Kisp01_26160 [Kineosporia sp. NBRC 101677]
MIRRFHPGHYVLAGLLAVTTLVVLAPGVSFSFGSSYGPSDGSSTAEELWESGPSGIGGAENDQWVMEDAQARTMEIAGWGTGYITSKLWRLARDGNADVDVWAYEHKATASPRSRAGQPDPVVSRLYLQATPRTPVEEWLDWSGSPSADFRMNGDVPGEASLAVEPGWFAPAGGQSASYVTEFTVKAGQRPVFDPVQEIEFRSVWRTTRSCSANGSEDEPEDCVTDLS